MSKFQQRIDKINLDWATNTRWKGIKRPYSAEEVIALQGSNPIEYSLAQRGSKKLWDLLNNED